MKIEGVELTQEHKGASVIYTKEDERGVIFSWNDHYVFVKYYNGFVPFELQPTAKATYPEDLFFAKKRD